MKEYIVLLRGINVGGHKKVPMIVLRELLESLGLQEVKTYIQTGNILLQSRKSREILAKIIDEAIQLKFGFSVSILIKTKEEFEEIIENNPFSNYQNHDEDYLKKLNVTFFRSILSKDDKEKIKDKRSGNEECFFAGNYLYLWCDDGFRNSKMAAIVSKNPDGTTRNWNSVIKINDL